MELDYAIVAYLKGELGTLACQKVKNLINTNDHFARKAAEWKHALTKLDGLKEKEYSVPSGYRELLMKRLAEKKVNHSIIGALAVIPVLLVGLGVFLLKRKNAA